jgi:hypothetical protein
MNMASGWIALGAWLFSAISGVETVLRLPLVLRLAVICAFALIGMVAAILAVPQHQARPVGFTSTGASGRSGWRKAVAGAVLAITLLAVLAVALLQLSISYHALTIAETRCQGTQYLRLAAPGSIAKDDAIAKVTVTLPRDVAAACHPFDPTDDRATVNLFGLSSPNPYLELLHFHAPQTFGLACSPPLRVSGVSVLPEPAVEVISPRRLHRSRIFNYTFGGVLWLVACGVAFVRFN